MSSGMRFFATVMLATSSQAASITWGFGGKVSVSEDGASSVLASDYTGTKMTGTYLALFYLGQGVETVSLDNISSYKQVGENLEYDVVKTGKASSIGKWNPNTVTYRSDTDSTMTYADGASFAVLFYNGSAFDYVYAVGSDGAPGDAVTKAYTITDMSDQGSASVYATGGASAAGVVAVPEPSVALLGLLGIGMLLKRRRA